MPFLPQWILTEILFFKHLASFCNHNELDLRIVCNKYCKENTEPLEGNTIRNILNTPTKTHKSLFRNANKSIVHASVYAQYWAYFHPMVYGHNRYACSELVLKSNDMGFCSYEVMAAITLSEVHTMTTLLLSKTNTTENNLIDRTAKGQFILTLSRYVSYVNIQTFRKAGLHFSGFISKIAIYCVHIGDKTNNETAILSIWLNLLNPEIWAVILLVLALLPFNCISSSISIMKTLEKGLKD